MMTIREKIIEKASELFLKYGIRTISMDELAKELSISKKTIYQHFKDKDELVFVVTKKGLEEDQCNSAAIIGQAENALDEMFLMNACSEDIFKDMSPSVLHDLEKFHPESWKIYEEYKSGYVQQIVIENFESGKKQGLYRQDFDSQVLAILFVELFELGIDPNLYPKEKFDLNKVQSLFFEHFIRGILSEEGIHYFENYTKLTQNQKQTEPIYVSKN
jgi:TetR/AcrR family transcriptional regulator, cholesterol catabolism regulator